MKSFPIDDDLVALVMQRAKPEPFETFSEALRRVLTQPLAKDQHVGKTPVRLSADELLAELDAMGDDDFENLPRYNVTRRQRAPSPSPENWLAGVPELRRVQNLRSWQNVCDHLGIEVAGDSARRKLKEWVQRKHPEWPPVPEV
jgi:hypothetical protein